MKREENIAHKILVEPWVTEKSTNLAALNKYIFKVSQAAGKRQVKDAIEAYYGVGVIKIGMVKINSKKRIQGRTIGYKQGFKKAIVTLRHGDSIGLAEGV